MFFVCKKQKCQEEIALLKKSKAFNVWAIVKIWLYLVLFELVLAAGLSHPWSGRANLGLWQDARSKEAMSEIYDGAKYFLEENSNFFKKFLTML